MNKFEEAWDKVDTRFDKELEELDNKARRVAREFEKELEELDNKARRVAREFENRRRALFAARDGQRNSLRTAEREAAEQ